MHINTHYTISKLTFLNFPQCKKGQTPLHLAALSGRNKRTQTLLQHGKIYTNISLFHYSITVIHLLLFVQYTVYVYTRSQTDRTSKFSVHFCWKLTIFSYCIRTWNTCTCVYGTILLNFAFPHWRWSFLQVYWNVFFGVLEW